MRPFIVLIVLFFQSIIASSIHSDVQLASIFNDHMVLQQKKSIPIWGTGSPGEKLKISFADQTHHTVVDDNGQWKIKLIAMQANKTSQNLKIEANNTIEIKDILIGEVWICSGQSNMAMGYQAVPELKALYPQPKNGLLRSIIVPTTVAFEPQDSFQAEWQTVPPNSAVAYAFSYHLQKDLDIPVGIIQTAWGSSSIEGWMPIELTETLPHFKQIMQNFESEDREKVATLIQKEKWEKKENIYLRTRPNILYNAMLHPIIPFAVRGMVWYQGEANSAKPLEYQQSLPVWVNKLRDLWQQEDFYFMPVMLPGYGRGAKEDTLDRPDTKSWNRFREAQMSVLKLPYTNVANTIDLGAVKNIHPKDKAPIGLRLAKMALRDIHHVSITGQGPTFNSVTFNQNTAIISFKYAKTLKTKDGKAPTSFWVAGEDKQWFPARAEIKHQQIILNSENIKTPVAVRYAYAAFPDVNLINEENLPAYPFRTDNW